jgi:hypothetical protein
MLNKILKFFRRKEEPKVRTLEDKAVELQKGIREGTIRTLPYFSDSVDSSLYSKYIKGNNNMREEINNE